MHIKELSIDPRGMWSRPQVKRVLAVINPEAAERGYVFRALDVSTVGGPERFLLVAHCLRHDIAIRMDSACAECLREDRPPKATVYPYHPFRGFHGVDVCVDCGENAAHDIHVAQQSNGGASDSRPSSASPTHRR